MATLTKVILNSIRRNIYPRILHTTTGRHYCKSPPIEEDLDKPIKFSTSKAATWKAQHSFSGQETEDVWPWYQPLVISGSLAVFMIYFGILREENDVDQGLSMSLYDRIEGLEEVQLRNAIAYYEENDKNYDTAALKNRLLELEQLKANSQIST